MLETIATLNDFANEFGVTEVILHASQLQLVELMSCSYLAKPDEFLCN